jgi:SET domain-containing protein
MKLPPIVELRNSSIEGAGIGVFATQSIEKDVVIGDYTGMEVDPETEGDYVLLIQGYDENGKEVLRCIDAQDKDHSGWPRYLNSVRRGDGLKKNCKFFINRDKISVKTTKDILSGEELLVDYGPDYVF